MNINKILQHYNKEHYNVVKDIINKFNSVIESNRVFYIGFVDTYSAKVISDISSHYDDVEIIVLNQHENEERKYYILKPKYFVIDIPNIIFLDVKYNKKYSQIRHQHVLGTLINSEIDFNKIGDIVVNSTNDIQITVEETVISDLQVQCEIINNLKVKYEISNTLLENDIEPIYKSFYTKSLRIDSVLKHTINKNRNSAKNLIDKKYVKINQELVNNYTKSCKLDDVITVRGYGRYEIISLENISGNRYNITIKS